MEAEMGQEVVQQQLVVQQTLVVAVEALVITLMVELVV